MADTASEEHERNFMIPQLLNSSSISNGINPYGDEYKVISVNYGSDISSQRRDDLDIACAQYALNLVAETMRNGQLPPHGLDIGSGLGVPSIAMSLLGCHMLLIDILDLHERFEIMRQLLPLSELIYLQKDAQALMPSDFPHCFDFAYSQRFLHYLRFENATALLQKISLRMNTESRIFISVSGLTSELGEDYPDANKPVHQRFACLSKSQATKHGIFEEVCLYTMADLIQLVESVGFAPIHVYQSRFGNVKGVFSKT